MKLLIPFFVLTSALAAPAVFKAPTDDELMVLEEEFQNAAAELTKVTPVVKGDVLFTPPTSFEKQLMQLEELSKEHEAKRAKLDKVTKAASASIGVAGFMGGAGYIASSAIPMSVMHNQHKEISEFNQAVADANARAKANDLHKRGEAVVDVAEKATSAVEHEAAEWRDYSLWDEKHPMWAQPEPVEVKQLQEAVLDMKRKQLVQPSKFSHWMLGLGGASAVGGLVSAELVNQNSVDFYMKRPAALADPANMDRATCDKYAAKIPNLDCSRAKLSVVSRE